MAISRIFNSSEDARAAVSELVQEGFREAFITVAQAQGGTRVRVDTPLGTAAIATRVLERRRASDSSAPKLQYGDTAVAYRAPWPDTASSVVLLNAPALLSSILGMPTLVSGSAGLSSLFGLGSIVESAAPLSSLFGLPVLL
jgi:hypothetical protein